ncbi:HDOD domain-containing protein [Thalassotalea sp. LPB0316]|uniref:EAL and HDOD domain-containing protein n=1 Tax=Thalassotalea sp. LPB0316 TaxID=2769490 RepID=UPI0018661B42|nr:HDOD domain-containing protein [Thalassotalea sp. LPB0316]QOL24436.1 HDOD domain-containing protein [Thalassotalea sp. LPB0316]
MYFYAARQPILNKEKELYAYELLFREGLDNVFPEHIDGDEATTKMIEASRFNAGVVEFTHGKPAFINFTLDTILKGYATMLATDEVVIEILETVKPGKRLLAECQKLKELGYTLVLDDYKHQKVWAHFYPYVDIIKVDMLETSVEEIHEIKNAIQSFPQITLLAEKVETPEQYQQCVDLGFELFQGYFFSKPEVVKARNLSPSQLAMAELLYEMSKPELDLVAITSVFERDVTLSYKLLRYVNSPLFRRRTEISTIKQALVILGIAELKKFLGLLFASNMNPDKPSELVKLSMARAKFCENIGAIMPDKVDTSTTFLIGLLSLIDAILDEEIGVVLDKLPLAQEIKAPLITGKGVMAALILLSEKIEKAEFDAVQTIIDKLGLNKEDVVKAYHDAVVWADEQTQMANG